jgi:hypothetical protein
MFQYSIIKKVIAVLCVVIKGRRKQLSLELQQKINGAETQLWPEFIQLCISYIRSNVLALENASESKQNMIKERYSISIAHFHSTYEFISTGGDMRIEVADILRQMWTSLEKDQIYFLQGVVGPYLELILVIILELFQLESNPSYFYYSYI